MSENLGMPTYCVLVHGQMKPIPDRFTVEARSIGWAIRKAAAKRGIRQWTVERTKTPIIDWFGLNHHRKLGYTEHASVTEPNGVVLIIFKEPARDKRCLTTEDWCNSSLA